MTMNPPPHHQRRRTRRGDDGAATAEMLCWVVAAMLLLGFAVYTIRGVTAATDVANTADAAARAASLAPTAPTAVTAATEVVRTDHGDACQQATVRVDTSRFRPGGMVTVTVTCTIVVADLPLTGLRSRLTASASAPIDTYITVTR
jgi:Flp pilus assembly protein TadG